VTLLQGVNVVAVALEDHGVVTAFDMRVTGTALPIFRRGNANGDLSVNIADAIWILQEVFRSGPESTCQDAADANNDSPADFSDAI
jgi:hypothetical protein